MSIYVAYNSYGDLIAESSSYDSLLWKIEARGYDLDEVVVGRAHP